LPNLPSLNMRNRQVLDPWHIGSFSRPAKRSGSIIIVDLYEVAPSVRSEFFGVTGPARSFTPPAVSNPDTVSPTPAVTVIWNTAIGAAAAVARKIGIDHYAKT
jgi:hypothetical protein